MNARLLLATALLALFTPACAYHGSAKAFRPERLESEKGWVFVRDVHVERQTTSSNCGAASLCMVLGHWGAPVTIDEISESLPVETGDGAFSAGEMRDVARGHGLHAFVIAGEIRDLQEQLAKNRPVIVGVVKRYSRNRGLAHYEVVVGYDAARKRIVTLDPAAGWREDSLAGFEKEWEASGRTTLVAFP